jgi:hypothetical protein
MIDTVEFTIVCLLPSMHNVVNRLAETSITVIDFSRCYSDPKYLSSLEHLEVFFWFEGDYSSCHHIWARQYHIFCQFGSCSS